MLENIFRLWSCLMNRRTYKNPNSYSNHIIYTWNRSYGFRISAVSVDGRFRTHLQVATYHCQRLLDETTLTLVVMTAAKSLITIAVIQVTCRTQNGRTPQNTDDDDNRPLNANIMVLVTIVVTHIMVMDVINCV